MCPSSARRSSLPFPQPRAPDLQSGDWRVSPTPPPAGTKVSRERGRPGPAPPGRGGLWVLPPARALGRGVEYSYSCAECEEARLAGPASRRCVEMYNLVTERVLPSLFILSKNPLTWIQETYGFPEGLPPGRASDYASVQFSSVPCQGFKQGTFQ